MPWGGTARRGDGKTVYVGQGARLYDFLGKWVPDGLVGWLVRRQEMRREGEIEKVSQVGGGKEKREAKQTEQQEQQWEGGLPLPRWGASSAGSSGSDIWEKL